MNASTIRQNFLDFFEKKGHKIVPSAPIVVQNDPTLMFTNAGMNQFKDYFLGNKKAVETRVADTQKCLRVSGKHNDLEEVGFDTYHHTMFEMLGNWSFGDYFKKEAIDWAWELLTEVYGLPKDRMYASVFEGDPTENLELDSEAKNLWLKHLPEDRVLNGNKKDNFWEMGDTGPCGPCSEVHIDLRPQSEIDKLPGRELVNNDHPLVIEIWNLVFIQYNRLADGSLQNLPQKHVDTGMGFERLAMAIQGKTSNYDTDVFAPLMDEIASRARVTYGTDSKTDVAIRVIADHIRAIAFTIADGQLPSNAKAGYVIRRILRRAVRYGYTFLGFKEPFLNELIPTLAKQFDVVFPELTQQQDFVSKVIREEELSFLRTLENGLTRIDDEINNLEKARKSCIEEVKSQNEDLFNSFGSSIIEGTYRKGPNEQIEYFNKKIGNSQGDQLRADLHRYSTISGQKAFELFDTFGFPLDLTRLIARENGLEVDEKGFEAEMAQQKDRSRASAKQDAGDWVMVNEVEEDSKFIGYDSLEADVQIVKYRVVKQKNKELYQLVLDRTPFYAESGGQVGDKGQLIAGDRVIDVFDTKKENELIVHFAAKLPADLSGIFHATINDTKRSLTQNNHSATHLLHAALRRVLGDHVQQKGSLVNDEILRFDFSHFAKMTPEELAEVEQIVNDKVRANINLDEKRNVPIAQAKEMGATALFGEKYGEYVRVITFDKDYSVELCGGTHVKATGQIGYFKIVSESSIAAGVRRIEAITASAAESFVNHQMKVLEEIDEILKKPKDPIKSIQTLLDEKAQLQKQLDALIQEKTKGIKNELKAAAKSIGDVQYIEHVGNFPDANAVKQLAFELKHEVSRLVLLLGAEVNGKPSLTVMLSDELVDEKGLNASEMVRTMAKEIQGGGGGQPFYATAGGKETSGLQAALKIGRSIIEEKIGS